MTFDNEQLIKFTKPISDYEDQKCQKAIGVVVNALKYAGYTTTTDLLKDPLYTTKANLGDLKLKIFLQGSYLNNTNVKLDSDIDIVVMVDSQFYPKYRPGISGKDYNFSIAQRIDIKSKIYDILCQHIGGNGIVTRKNKCIKLKENSWRASTDVVPCVEYRDYSNDYFKDPNNYVSGIKITCDDGTEIINYPRQHFENGRKKNENTNFYYKKVVRIIKNIRNLMEESGQSLYAKHISSFHLESLLWNIPNQYFLQYDDNYLLKVASIINLLLQTKHQFIGCKEVNDIKLLFPTREMVQLYQMFVDELRYFYQWV